MKREELEKHWNEVVAFKNGAELQHRFDPCPGLNSAWEDVGDAPSFEGDRYRVKPGTRKFVIEEVLMPGGCERVAEYAHIYTTKTRTIEEIKAVLLQQAPHVVRGPDRRSEIDLGPYPGAIEKRKYIRRTIETNTGGPNGELRRRLQRRIDD